MLKKIVLLLVTLASSQLFSQISIGGVTPTEGVESKGTLRVRELPMANAQNAISTETSGSRAITKNQTFVPKNTVVADSNGVLGIVPGLPILDLPGSNTISYNGTSAIINTNVNVNSLISLGNLAVYLEPAATTNILSQPMHIRFCLLNNVHDIVVVNMLKLGSGGIAGQNETFTVTTSGNVATLASSIPAIGSSNQAIWHKTTRQVFSVINNDFIEYTISLLNSKEVYRLTGVATYTVSTGLTSPAMITFFLERLSN